METWWIFPVCYVSLPEGTYFFFILGYGERTGVLESWTALQTTIVTSPPLELALNLGVNQAHEILQAHSCLPFATDRHQVTPCTELVPSSAIVASASLSPEKKGLLLHMPAHDLVGSFLSVIPPLELKGKCLDGDAPNQLFQQLHPKSPHCISIRMPKAP